ncbi:type 1 glutamine amidotransferase [Rhizohabitans arisaemae]|uniref:type 1 glutamine amidotransferase n=1 Tax=Rhizohabitans arisaemae TaxID=2720610 RepID=UPI0024B271E1|nr:type 1 glutamine amidotransferase [Rhizohabitans arisaemae]
MILAIQHEHGTDPGLVGERVQAAGITLDLRHPYRGDELPASLAGHRGLLVLGGTPGADDHDTAPWLPRVKELLREAVRDRIPTLGVCLGGQLLAAACGGAVAVAARPQVGLYGVRAYPAAADDPLFRGFPEDGQAVQWHWDEIVTLPPGAVPLLWDADFPHQAFRLGPVAWGLQFHPEVLSGAARVWARDESGELARLGVDVPAMLDRIGAAEPALRVLWGEVTDRWIGIVRGAGI